MADLTLDELVDRVTTATVGDRHDYLTRGDVEQVVTATLLELEAAGAGSIGGMSETPETPTPEPDPTTPPTPGEPPAPEPVSPESPGVRDPEPAE